MKYVNGQFVVENEHHFRVGLIIQNPAREIQTETRDYTIYAANHDSAASLAWECIRQDQQVLFAQGAIAANTCQFRTVILGHPRYQ